eukprot:5755554-Ditylum_brightwellii.AAC.1
MKEYNIDVLGFAETNLAWSMSLECMAKCHSRKVFKQFALVTCSSDDSTSTVYQPGGVCMGVVGPSIGRILEMIKDPSGLGCW